MNAQRSHYNPMGNPPPLSTHARTRTSSSTQTPQSPIVVAPSLGSSSANLAAMPLRPAEPTPNYPPASYGAYGPSPLAPPTQSLSSRRSPSINTVGSVSAISQPPPSAYRASPSSEIRRSTSSRSADAASTQAPSYVALLRKQKATVWSERSQYEDPRVLAHFKAAKAKASMELAGSSSRPAVSSYTARTTTGLTAGKLVGKVRHHKSDTNSHGPDLFTFVGVTGLRPRLSTAEVEGGDDEEEDLYMNNRIHHRRTGSSGRSSTTSMRRTSQFRSSGSLTQRHRSPANTPERTGSLVQEMPPIIQEPSPMMTSINNDDHDSIIEQPEDEGNDGDSFKLVATNLLHHTLKRAGSTRTPDELRRRGSVDDRALPRTTGRLFIANPD